MASNQVNSGTWTNPLPTVVDRNWELILNSLSDWLANPNIAQGGLTVGDPVNGEVVITGTSGSAANQGMVQFWYNNNHDANLLSYGDNSLWIQAGPSNVAIAYFGINGFQIVGPTGGYLIADNVGTRVQETSGRHVDFNVSSGGLARVNSNPIMVGTGTAQPVLQAGVAGVTTNASGQATITFPSAFPTSCTSVVAQIQGGTAGGNWVTATINYTTTSFGVVVRNSTGLAASLSAAIAWQAVGT